MDHSYAGEFAEYVHTLWAERRFCRQQSGIDCRHADALPGLNVLEHILSVCFQASLLREEERPVRFRLILREPGHFPAADGPPHGFHRLVFSEPRPFTEHELQRLAPAADFYRSLVGVRYDPERGVQIWGLVHSGPRWVQNIYGGRLTAPPLPLSLVVCVTDPGRITVGKGSVTIATLHGGVLASPREEVFGSHWLGERFATVRDELWGLHLAARAEAGKPWAELDREMVRIIPQQAVRRMISSIRNARHGGIIIFLPTDLDALVAGENPYLDMKYHFTREEPRQRFRTLMVRLMNTLAEAYGDAPPGTTVGWDEYVASRDERLHLLDEALFEVAHLFAGLAAVDGAVVLSKRFELLGFGAEISSRLEGVATVARALDAEGNRTEPEPAGVVGTRHRSVYRLCNAVREAVAIVVSQDRSVRFVAWKGGAVTSWSQVATSVLDY
jgi:hypothetical protein